VTERHLKLSLLSPWGHDRISAPPAQEAALRVADEAGFDGIESDVPDGFQKVTFIERGRIEAALPELAGLFPARLGRPNVLSVGLAHGARERRLGARHEHGVDVVEHEAIGPNLAVQRGGSRRALSG
jgi:hypothetical protein